MTQLKGSINAVFSSWDNDRAKVYRQKYGIPAEWGTAVNVQAMVFGNTGTASGTGVAFTRDPATGEDVFYGEYLIDAQGEDVVAGVRTPKQVARMAKDLPQSHAELLKIRKTLESHFRDVQDIEFTIEEGTLWMLQTRTGKRTGFAAVNIAVDMVNEGLISKEEAISANPGRGPEPSPRTGLQCCCREKSPGHWQGTCRRTGRRERSNLFHRGKRREGCRKR